jgi:tRNA U34 5-methylaminomethyl-2-thiouridine-forming methyltransferase MnmC
MADQTAIVDWHGGATPVSRAFDDPYYSTDDGLGEARHTFLAGNGLPDRFVCGFHIAELGFGTGLNALAAWQAWQQAGVGGALRFTSFEAYPMCHRDIARALAAFPELGALANQLLAQWPPRSDTLNLPGLTLRVIPGDGRDTLRQWGGSADAWFLDGFSPAKNPDLWGAALMDEVARHTAPHGSFATYTAAGSVRRALSQAGFTVRRVPGFGRKRHMTTGRLR